MDACLFTTYNTLLQKLDFHWNSLLTVKHKKMKLRTEETKGHSLSARQPAKTEEVDTWLKTLWHTDLTALRLLWSVFIGTVYYIWHCAKYKNKLFQLQPLNWQV